MVEWDLLYSGTAGATISTTKPLPWGRLEQRCLCFHDWFNTVDDKNPIGPVDT